MGSISYLWSLPIICEPYQLFVGSTRHLWVLSVIYRAYQSSVGSTSHLCGLPAICVVYQPSVWSTSHLCGLSAICGIYQQSVGSTSHLWGLPAICGTDYWSDPHTPAKSQELFIRASRLCYKLLPNYHSLGSARYYGHYRTIDSMGNIEKTWIMQIGAGSFCEDTESADVGICVPGRVSYITGEWGVRSTYFISAINGGILF